MLEDFDIHGEINVQICTGALKIKGAGKYATNSNYNTKVVQYNQILKTTTRKETFNWKYLEDKDYDLPRAETQGTHMVVGIQYGGNAVITLKQKVTNESSVQEVRGNLSVALQGSKIPFVSGGEAGASLENIKKNNKCFQHIKISIEADIVSGKNGDISSIEGVKQFMDTFGGELMKYNDKKGIQNAEMNSVRFINNLREFEKMKRVHKDFYVCILPSENFTDYQQVLDKFVESAKDKTATKHFLLNSDVFPNGGGEEFGFQKTEKYPYYRYKNDEYVKIWDTFEGYKLPTFVNMSIGFSRPECTCARNAGLTTGCTELYEILIYQNSTLPAKNTTKFCAEWHYWTGYKVEVGALGNFFVYSTIILALSWL
uniref:Uncharacterized protein n=1 Tax=Panagrolaimus davidi TaxID=227884 RepID=A0A914PMZ8_9BILA